MRGQLKDAGCGQDLLRSKEATQTPGSKSKRLVADLKFALALILPPSIFFKWFQSKYSLENYYLYCCSL